MTLAASVVQASMITPSRSYRTRNRRSPLSQLIVRSTTQRTLPSPLPCGVLRLAMCGSIPSHRSNALERLAVVAPVGVRLVGQLLGPARHAADLGEVEDHREDLACGRWRWPRRCGSPAAPPPCRPSRCASCRACRRSTGLGPVASPPPKARTVTPSMITVSGSSLPARLSSRQQVGVEPVPDAGLLPGPEPAVGGPAGAAEFRRDVLPAGAGGQDEPDDPDDDPVADPGPAALGADGLLGREVMGDGVEELLRHVGAGHGGSLLE